VDEPLPLARDVLDKQVIDPDGCKVGKVDGIVLALREHRPPRVIAMEISQALQSYPSIQLRMGVHSGPISRNGTVPHLPKRAVLDDLDIIGHNTVERLTRLPHDERTKQRFAP